MLKIRKMVTDAGLAAEHRPGTITDFELLCDYLAIPFFFWPKSKSVSPETRGGCKEQLQAEFWLLPFYRLLPQNISGWGQKPNEASTGRVLGHPRGRFGGPPLSPTPTFVPSSRSGSLESFPGTRVPAGLRDRCEEVLGLPRADIHTGGYGYTLATLLH